ncbi:MAG: hypothetical protein V1821_03210, partial [bacterium]
NTMKNFALSLALGLTLVMVGCPNCPDMPVGSEPPAPPWVKENKKVREVPPPESCGDGLDNDGDGWVDNGCWTAAYRVECQNGERQPCRDPRVHPALGVCAGQGNMICVMSRWPNLVQNPELCLGAPGPDSSGENCWDGDRDGDCDGNPNNGCDCQSTDPAGSNYISASGKPCGPSQGICAGHQGRIYCDDGRETSCRAPRDGSLWIRPALLEECNGLDDDCDGLVDEDLSLNQACGVCGPEPAERYCFADCLYAGCPTFHNDCPNPTRNTTCPVRASSSSFTQPSSSSTAGSSAAASSSSAAPSSSSVESSSLPAPSSAEAPSSIEASSSVEVPSSSNSESPSSSAEAPSSIEASSSASSAESSSHSASSSARLWNPDPTAPPPTLHGRITPRDEAEGKWTARHEKVKTTVEAPCSRFFVDEACWPPAEHRLLGCAPQVVDGNCHGENPCLGFVAFDPAFGAFDIRFEQGKYTHLICFYERPDGVSYLETPPTLDDPHAELDYCEVMLLQDATTWGPNLATWAFNPDDTDRCVAYVPAPSSSGSSSSAEASSSSVEASSSAEAPSSAAAPSSSAEAPSSIEASSSTETSSSAEAPSSIEVPSSIEASSSSASSGEPSSLSAPSSAEASSSSDEASSSAEAPSSTEAPSSAGGVESSSSDSLSNSSMSQEEQFSSSSHGGGFTLPTASSTSGSTVLAGSGSSSAWVSATSGPIIHAPGVPVLFSGVLWQGAFTTIFNSLYCGGSCSDANSWCCAPIGRTCGLRVFTDPDCDPSTDNNVEGEVQDCGSSGNARFRFPHEGCSTLLAEFADPANPSAPLEYSQATNVCFWKESSPASQLQVMVYGNDCAIAKKPGY